MSGIARKGGCSRPRLGQLRLGEVIEELYARQVLRTAEPLKHPAKFLQLRYENRDRANGYGAAGGGQHGSPHSIQIAQDEVCHEFGNQWAGFPSAKDLGSEAWVVRLRLLRDTDSGEQALGILDTEHDIHVRDCDWLRSMDRCSRAGNDPPGVASVRQDRSHGDNGFVKWIGQCHSLTVARLHCRLQANDSGEAGACSAAFRVSPMSSEPCRKSIAAPLSGFVRSAGKFASSRFRNNRWPGVLKQVQDDGAAQRFNQCSVAGPRAVAMFEPLGHGL